MKITFLGGVGTVTGSKYLLEYRDKKVLVDCGLFQGLKELRLRNWQQMPFNPAEIDAIILTHAHLDHSGYIPILVRNGFKGEIYCTTGTWELCKILLPDSARIQEEDAENANYHNYSKHSPALPLYTEDDAFESFRFFKPIDYNKGYNIGENLNFTFKRNGHIIGSASVIISYNGKRIVFSGDMGREDDPIMRAPDIIDHADYLVMESTYGDRDHKKVDIAAQLEKIINETIKVHGKVIIPSFAVGRAQSLIYFISKLIAEDRIPRDLPIFLDSPMAVNASDIFKRHPESHKLSYEQCRKIFGNITYIRSVAESQKVTNWPTPCVIISASGMATGGRVLHHLEHLAPDERNTIVLAGYQAEGTRGHRVFIGEKEIKIHGHMVPIKAKVEMLENISAHADSTEILNWLGHFKTTPKVFVTHGEKSAANSLKEKIEAKFGWNCTVPKMEDFFEI